MGVAFGGHSGTESNATVATVVLDADGKIVLCHIDVAQNKYGFDEDEEDIVFTRLVSKMELGDDYGMAGKVDNNGDGIMLEWYLQTEAFEEYVVGMTADEVAAMATQPSGTHNISADDALLNAGCTIDIVDFKAAVVKACNDEQGVTFETDKDFTLGVAVNSANDGSSADDEENYTIKMNVEFAASVVIDGKVAATVNDAYQPNIIVVDGEVEKATVGTFNKAGVEDLGMMSKRELKELYNMIPASPIQTEWYVQSANYSEFVIGMTADEIAGLTLDSGLSEAGCTIYIGGINAVVAESVRNAVGATEGDPIVPTPETYTLGMGVAFGGHSGTESNATVATVVLDADGKIVFCRIDVAQNKYAFDEDEEDIVFTRLVSKMELGDGYGMAGKIDNNGDGIMLEWYLQAKAFETYVIGKTVDEVAAMTTQLVNNHNISADDALLNAGCTIDIVDFKAAVVKACNDEQGVEFVTDKDFTLGVAVNSANDGSSADDEENYTIKMNVEFAASVVIDGKVAATVNDAYQPNIVVADGEVVSATVGKGEENGLKTKRELKEAYGMDAAHVDKNGDGVSLEWYLQSAAYSEYVVGMTADEIAGLEAGDDLIEADCTIYIGGINAVVAESVTNAR